MIERLTVENKKENTRRSTILMELDLGRKSYGCDVSVYEEPALDSWGRWLKCFHQLQDGNWNKNKTMNSRGMADQLTQHGKEKEHLFTI